MTHENIFDQARCDITQQTDNEVFGEMLGKSTVWVEGVLPCSTCGEDVCMACGKHVRGDGKCPMPKIAEIMES